MMGSLFPSILWLTTHTYFRLIFLYFPPLILSLPPSLSLSLQPSCSSFNICISPLFPTLLSILPPSPHVSIRKIRANLERIQCRNTNSMTNLKNKTYGERILFFSNFSDSKYYTTLDMSKGYWQVSLGESIKQYTGFQTDQGLYQFLVLHFGLTNAPAAFNKLMRILLQDMPGVHQFLDDLFLCTES